MGERTTIEWTQRTWNPWRGCTKVSPGCAKCYMFREQERYGQDPAAVVRTRPATFNAPLRWEKRLAAEDRRELVFTCSWSDWFHEDADAWRGDAWAIVRSTPHLTYQILTKRPERIRAHLPFDWGRGYPNVWLGTSIENQRWAVRALHLLTVPAAVHFVSAEPLLGPLDLTRVRHPEDPTPSGLRPVFDTVESNVLAGTVINSAGIEYQQARRIAWVIVGGESGPTHRPMQADWARALRDQCRSAKTAFFLKQLGGPANAKQGGAHAILDGQRYTAMPAVA